MVLFYAIENVEFIFFVDNENIPDTVDCTNVINEKL
jgi:hypothetical protein